MLAFNIPTSNKKPVYFNNPKNTFIRAASGDQRATQEEIDTMYRDQAYGTITSRRIKQADITMPRNPIIAELFRVVKLSENAGYGFD